MNSSSRQLPTGPRLRGGWRAIFPLILLLVLAAKPAYGDVQVDVGGPPKAPVVAEASAPPPEPENVVPRPRSIGGESRFEPAEVERNPFWPLGWRPYRGYDPDALAVKPLRFAIAPGTFRLSSIMLGDRALAVINGKSYGVGEQLYLQVEQNLVAVEVAAVLDGAVVVDIGGAHYRISMRRRGLSGKMETVTEAVDKAAEEAPRALPMEPPQLTISRGLINATAQPADRVALEPSQSSAGLLTPPTRLELPPPVAEFIAPPRAAQVATPEEPSPPTIPVD